MSVRKRVERIALGWSLSLALAGFGFAQGDEGATERALGPQWRQMSRRAGMIFAGTVLGAAPADGLSSGPTRSISLRFHVDRAIAGVKPGETLTVREWAGSGSQQPRLRSGRRVLIFLYPLSRLGLTSPVGGARGLIGLDSSGMNVARLGRSARRSTAAGELISLDQLERAIRSARPGREGE